MSIFASLESRRVQLEATRENSSRPARLLLRFHTSGSGELKMPRAIEFGLAFLEQPHVTTGVALSPRAVLETRNYPNCCAGVWQWVKNSKGLYTGARLFFVVDSNDWSYELEHTLVFEAPAIKMFPAGMG